MNLSSLVASGFLLASSFAGHAQATEPAPIPRFYGGLGLYTSSHQNLSSWGIDGARIPVQAVVGYQWRPRLAVQLGVAYSGNRSQYAYNYFYSPNYPAPAGAKTDVAGTYTERSITTSLLARYTLTRKLAHRFQADLIGGVKVEYSRYHDVGISTSYRLLLSLELPPMSTPPPTTARSSAWASACATAWFRSWKPCTTSPLTSQ